MSNDLQIKSKPPEGYDLSLAEAAAIAGVHERSVRRWAGTGRKDRGVLHSVETVHGLWFRSADVRAFSSPRALVPGSRSTAARLGDAIACVVAEAPTLTRQQREQLAVVLVGGLPEIGGE